MSNRQWSAQVVFIVGLLACASLVMSRAPARADEPSEDFPPVLSSPSVAPSSLPHDGGSVNISVDVTDDVGVTTVYAELAGPNGTVTQALSITTGNTYAGSVTVPGNLESSSVSYQVSIIANDTNGGATIESIGDVQVAEAPQFDELPVLSDATVTPDSLPSSGGQVTLSAFASDTEGLSEVYATITLPDGGSTTVTLDAIDATHFQAPLNASANVTFSSVSYAIVITASDSIGQTVSSDPIFLTVAGQTGGGEQDSDGDGTLDSEDGCPNDSGKIEPGVCGCGTGDVDSDNDGALDCQDQCPGDPNKISDGVCGCNISDADSDGDQVADCNDGCPSDGQKSSEGICGCGVSDEDTDGDGIANCLDTCPSDPLKDAPGTCGCGFSDNDSDGDGAADCNDGCPSDAAKLEPGVCGCGFLEADPCEAPPVEDPELLVSSRAFEGAEGDCEHGGLEVSYGLDDDASGTLDEEEIDASTYVCSDAPPDPPDCPEAPAASLVEVSELGAGDVTCVNGGKLVRVGRDDGAPGGVAGDGLLQAEEVESTSSVCVELEPAEPPPPTSSPECSAAPSARRSGALWFLLTAAAAFVTRRRSRAS